MRKHSLFGLVALAALSIAQPAYADTDSVARAIASKAYRIANALANNLAPANIDLPQISGTLTVGSVLTASPGTWTTNPTFTYQWMREGVPISGATNAAYTTVDADKDHALTVNVTATNPMGSTTKAAAAVFISTAVFVASLNHSDARNSQYL
jgi:hypothetical protein